MIKAPRFIRVPNTIFGTEHADSRRYSRAYDELNLWSSAMYHRLLGGEGTPSRDECLAMVSDTPTALPAWAVGHHDGAADATPRKYEQSVRARIDVSVQSALVVVDQTLSDAGSPPELISLLLWVHPERGRFEGARSVLCQPWIERHGIARVQRAMAFSSDQPFDSFRPVALTRMQGRRGEVTNSYAERHYSRFAQATYRAFVAELARRIGARVRA